MGARIASVDCSVGVSEEVLLTALLDAGLSLDLLKSLLTLLPLQDYNLELVAVRQGGMHGSRLVIVPSAAAQGRRALTDVSAILQTPALPVHVRETSLNILQRLEKGYRAASGSAMHEDITFSEAEALSIIVCTIGVLSGMDELGIAQVYASPLPLTDGFVETSQGLRAVPSPAVLEILREVRAPWQGAAFAGELVTPMGAALLAALASFERPTISIERTGYAFGHVYPVAEHPLRLHIGQQADQESARVEDADTDWVAVIESHIDNMSGELLGGLMERLFSLGALDVAYSPLQMKKNRPASLVTVICPSEQGERFALILLRETSTLGVRIQHVRRLKAQREQRRIDTPLGTVIVKIKRLGARVISVAPEYEECRRIAREQNMPLAEVYERVQRAIQNAII